MTTLAKRSFTGGELAPALYSRTDTSKYQTGTKTMRNCWIMRSSGTQNRPGTQFVDKVFRTSAKARLLPFIFNSDQSYILELGNLYMRVIKDGAPVLESVAKTITGITQANPAVVTSVAHGLSSGDIIYMTDPGGMRELTGGYFEVLYIGANTFSLKYLDTTAVNSTAFTAYSSGGTLSKIYTVTSPWDEDDLNRLKFIQSADVMTVVHPDYPTQEITRVANATWTISDKDYLPEASWPTAIAGSGSAGAVDQYYIITGIDSDTGEESLAGITPAQNISAITNANPGRVTTAVAIAEEGQEIIVNNPASGMTEINYRRFIAKNVVGAAFDLYDHNGDPVNTTSYGVYTTLGSIARTYVKVTAAQASPSAAVSLTYVTAFNSKTMVFYKRDSNGVYGFIGAGPQFTYFYDIGQTPDPSDNPPAYSEQFGESGKYPNAIGYYQQRLAVGGIDNDPERLFLSKTGSFGDFALPQNLQDDDPIAIPIAGRQPSEIRHIIDLGRLVVLTSSAEMVVGEGGALTPATISVKQQSSNGASNVSPALVDNSAIYVQSRGSILRDLAFEFESDGYRGNDVTIFATHLFEGYEIVEMAYQATPHSIVWALRSDGVLLGMTYIRDQQILGWHRHDFGGNVKSIAVIPEGSEDVLYVLVERVIGASTYLYVERLGARSISDEKDMIFMDCSFTYDGRNTNTGHTMDLSGGTLWDETEILTLTSSTAYFKAADIGNEIHLTGPTGDLVRCEITAYTGTTIVSVRPDRTVPAAMRTPLSTWAMAVDSVSGLRALEGENVSVLGDGYVVESPNNSTYTVKTVSSGALSFDECYSVIQIGLPYFSDIETLDIDTDGTASLQTKKKLITEVGMRLDKTRGVFVGPKAPSDDAVNPKENLEELRLRQLEGYDEPVDLFSGAIPINIRSQWSKGGRIFIRQIDPIPMTILSVAATGMIQGSN